MFSNQSESLIALRIVKDHLNSKNVTAANDPITRNMISNVKAARARYFDQAKKERRKSKQNQLEKKSCNKWNHWYSKEKSAPLRK